MTIYTDLYISGVKHTDFKELNVQKSTSEHGTSSNFTASFDTPFGRHDDDFNVGNEVVIFVSPEKLSAYYKLNTETGSQLVDFFGQNNGSIISGLSSRLVAGKLGSAYQFGSPCFGIQNDLFPGRRDEFSIAFWVNPTQWNLIDRIVDQQEGGPTHGFTFVQAGGTGSVQFVIRSGTTTVAALTNALPNNTWTHIVGTQNNSTQTAYLYVNGSFSGSDITSYMSAVSTSTNLNIGKRTGANSNYFSGLIDDLRFYDKEIDLTEVRRIYNNGSGYEDKNLFKGLIEEISFEGESTRQDLLLTGRDYTARLMDVTVEPVVYTSTEVGSIVRNIVTNEVTDITTNNVDTTTTTLNRISFNHISVYDAIKQLGELAGFIFYVDEDKDLHFEEKNITSSNLTFDNTNIKSSRFDRTRENFFNQIWVYGDRQLTGVKEILPTGSLTTGSVLTLINKPHNTEVESSAFPGSLLKGGILNMVGDATSGPDYLVNFDDRQIVFRSGTTLGYNSIPITDGSVIINYQRSVPIAKFGEDSASISSFGPKEKVIIDKQIKDPQTARDILIQELEKNEPPRKIELTLNGWFDITPGQTAVINIPNFGLNNRTAGILDVQYNFNPFSVHEENVISVNMENKIIDITDRISELNKRLSLIEASDAADVDLITRLKTSLGSLIIVGSYWAIQQRWNGSGFILGGSGFAKPSGADLNNFYHLGKLGSFNPGSASYLGEGGLTNYTIVRSGGFNYSVL